LRDKNSLAKSKSENFPDYPSNFWITPEKTMITFAASALQGNTNAVDR